MAFSTSELAQLETLLAGGGGAQLAAGFREQFPGRSLTRCDASDMGAEQPYRRYAELDLYFVDGRDHCWQITADPAVATGVVLARHRGKA
jgi:hypothetical protein